MSVEAWIAQLDRFERDLECPEASPWHPDPTLGPLPAQLLDRARSIAARQIARTARLHGELAETRAQLDAARLIPARRTDEPAYVEIDG